MNGRRLATVEASVRFFRTSFRNIPVGWGLLIFLIGSFQIGLSAGADEIIPRGLPTNTGFYCYVRCLAKCVDAQTTNVITDQCKTKCATYNDDSLCETKDETCWSTCKSLFPTKTGPLLKIPSNVTVAYAVAPQPTPYQADVRWQSIPSAVIYVVQYVDLTDAFAGWSQGGLGKNVTSLTSWMFEKPDLCPSYAFRVASATQDGISDFSEIVVLPTPTPVVPSVVYSMASAELINEPFVDPVVSTEAVHNTSVRLYIEFAPPPNWNMSTDIIKVTANLHVLNCRNAGQVFSPSIIQVDGMARYMVLLPGSVAYSESQCNMLFSVRQLYTKCNPRTPVPYPEGVFESVNGISSEFFFQLNCHNIHGSNCPYSALSLFPSCGTSSVKYKFSYRNDSNLADVDIQFGRVLGLRNETILHYLVRYGEMDDIGSSIQQPPNLVNITTVTGNLIVPNDTDTFVLGNLDTYKNYAFQICAIYTENTDVKWSIAARYPLTWDTPDRYFVRHPVNADESSNKFYLTSIVAPIALALVIAAIAFILLLIRFRRLKAKSIDELRLGTGDPSSDDGRYVLMPRRTDEWELERSDLIIYQNELLGAGAFGSVYKCKVTNVESRKSLPSILRQNWSQNNGEAAVKLLPEYADEMAKSDFHREINMMKKLGYHERLVNMLGCVTADEPLCLIVEHCEEGDLLHYLRDRRKYMIKLESLGIDLNNPDGTTDISWNLVLCFKDLLAFAWQISVGLEYLSQKGFIHRDVAARNVLVDREKRAKIGDFGLCRYAYNDSIYIGRGGRLPIKWMAPESIKNYEFTIMSDVWSYGVLLFELITMGGSPYPNVQPADVESFLDSGRRMECPDNCPPALYKIMLNCWRFHTDQRPTFTSLREQLRKLLEQLTVDYYYLKLNDSRDYYNVINNSMSPESAEAGAGSGGAENKAFTVDEEIEIDRSNRSDSEGDRRSNDTSGGEPASPPAVAVNVGGLPHRDSVNSEQFLITPTSSASKFFKSAKSAQDNQSVTELDCVENSRYTPMPPLSNIDQTPDNRLELVVS